MFLFKISKPNNHKLNVCLFKYLYEVEYMKKNHQNKMYNDKTICVDPFKLTALNK